ncbi:uncharacterized protein si:zfos-741a10.3 [Anoplopoma fimbria]|uniref:uncharacterized protein si:zfos-741a10.3 n=1 Tax=Anoplopoma fimbria TaxID=229290 RepID=UPI0023EB5913|nr:uncharacterized protein si:zfos-741a10.3 [Anoplopoma fimbria]
MEPVLILLMMLAGVSHAFFPVGETKCNATQNTSLCAVTLGGSVNIQLMTNAIGYQLRCKKQLPTGAINIFSLRKEKVTIQEPYENRTEFFINNGTLKITKVERNDSAQYTVDVHENGFFVKTIYFKLDVQENILHILIPVVSAVGVLLIVVVCCCVCRKVRRRKKSGKQLRKSTLNSAVSELT